MFDLEKIAAIETLFVPFKDGEGITYTDDKGNEVGVMVFGPASPMALRYKEKANRKANAYLKSPNRKPEQTIEKFEQENREFLIDMTASTVNFKIGNLKDTEAITALHTDQKFKLLSKQVNDFLNKQENFLPSA